MRLRIQLLIVLCLTTWAGNLQAEETRLDCAGPMRLPAIGLFQSSQYTPIIYGPLEIRNKKWMYSLSSYWVNIWAYNIEAEREYQKGEPPESFPFEFGSYLMDMETISMEHSLAYGLTERWEMELSIPVHFIGGGVLDRFIETFHDSFGVDQHRRDYMPRNRVQIFFTETDGTQRWLNGSDAEGTALGNVSLTTGYKVRRIYPPIAIRLGVKLPTSTDKIPLNQTGFDISIQYSTALNLYAGRIYHGAAMVWYQNTGYPPAKFRKWRLISSTTYELPTRHGFSFLFHCVSNTPSADFPKLDEFTLELTLGMRLRWSVYQCDIGFIENMFWYDNSPDFGIFFGLKRSF